MELDIYPIATAGVSFNLLDIETLATLLDNASFNHKQKLVTSSSGS